MDEGIQIYKFNNFDIYKPYFYYMTNLDFMYNKRHLFSMTKNGLKYNSYFPFDMVKNETGFYGLYLSAYVFDSSGYIDSDFGTGFNNIGYNFEWEILNILRSMFNEIRVVIKIYNSKENRSIIQKAEKEYNILFSSEGIYNIYIIGIKGTEDINSIQKYVDTILADGNDNIELFRQCSFEAVDLKCIFQMSGQYGLVLSRVPFFANYNIMLYSKTEDTIDKINGKILELKSKELNIENITDSSEII